VKRSDKVTAPSIEVEHPFEWIDLARIGVVSLASILVGRVWEPLSRVSVIGVAGAAVGMYPILREAFEAIVNRRMTMELSMSIAIGAALAIGEFFTALVIILFVLVAEVLEGMTVSRGRKVSTSGGIHPCSIGAGVHTQFRTITAMTNGI